MREMFKAVNFQDKALETIRLCNEIVSQYVGALTLRQLYYQLVVRNAIPNREQEYKRLGHIVSEARLAGLYREVWPRMLGG